MSAEHATRPSSNTHPLSVTLSQRKSGAELEFNDIERNAHAFADLIERKFPKIEEILLEYESHEVVEDEVARTLDLLRNLRDNAKYFKYRVGAVAAFLPRNQPLYALTCFVVIPSYMSTEVHFRIPQSMRHFFPKFLEVLEVAQQFPNVKVSNLTRLEFLRERSALRMNSQTEETIPVTAAVIFTGTSVHADQLRHVFDPRTLFISNGSGHNPIIISSDAVIENAVEAVTTLQLYNQGQDCAAPNSILVHKKVMPLFLEKLRESISQVKVGLYKDRSCRVGPISDPEDLVRIQNFLVEHKENLDPTTPGLIRTGSAIVEPTIICKPLSKGGNFSEIFAPIIFVQEYSNDSQLALYFEDQRYAQNAMYVTTYGSSAYISSLKDKKIAGKILHDSSTMLFDTHLHVRGVERGTRPYGGYGYGASSVSINNKLIHKPTLPQRDIYELVARPLMRKGESVLTSENKYPVIVQKNVEKLLKLIAHEAKNNSEHAAQEGDIYIDREGVIGDGRYIKLDPSHAYTLLCSPNVDYIAQLKPVECEQIRALHALLSKKDVSGDFATQLYAIPAIPAGNSKENQARQKAFFKHIYNLLLGTSTGPRLAQFLLEINRHQVLTLLDI